MGDILRAGTARLSGHTESPFLDALVLLEWSSRTTREVLLASLPDPARAILPGKGLSRFEDAVRRRASGLPVATIIGEKEFYGRVFRIEAGVLVPRPETELVVDVALALVADLTAARRRPLLLHDAFTGSGCIGITVALEAHHAGIPARAFLSDHSEACRGCARSNATALGAEIEAVIAADGIVPVGAPIGPADLITANPPYLSTEETGAFLARGTSENRTALDGGADGLDLYRGIATHALDRLAAGGYLVAECGATQGTDVADLFRAAGLEVAAITPDLAGRDRVVTARSVREHEWKR